VRRARPRTGRRHGGFGTAETIAASGIVVIGLAAFLQASSLSYAFLVEQRDAQTALDAVRAQVETLRSAPLSQVFATHNENAADDPGGPATAAGPDFAVAALRPAVADADAVPGEIRFPVGGVGGGELREDLDLPEFGLPRDLNEDGAIDATDHAGDYAILPVIVSVEWRSRRGDRRVEVATILSGD